MSDILENLSNRGASMMTKRWLVWIAALMVFAAPASAQYGESVGEVEFENSGADEAQEAFHRALALLHNFEYPRAAAVFREAQEIDPGFAMAYWGEAMTHNHPIWQQQDRDAARAVMARLGETRAARIARGATERERAYLEAIEILFGDGDKQARDFLYSDAMADIHATWPDDEDATAFYALSILGLAHEGRDFALYMRSAAELEEIYPDNLNHPGVLHYLIHSYDDPVHAPLGLRAARRYGAVAPNAGHALHMTSHIFVAMGMWPEVVAANQQATHVVNTQRAERGRDSYNCGHYPEWLIYGYLQQGNIAAADSAIAACRANAESQLTNAETHPEIEPYRNAVSSYHDVALMRLVDTGEWSEDPLQIPQGAYRRSTWMQAYGNLLRGRGDRAAIAAARESLLAVNAAMNTSDATPASSSNPHREIILNQASGLSKLASGDIDGGIGDLRAAAEAEAALPAEFGPPMIHKPSFELLAEELVRLGRIEQAREAYARAEELTPGRRLIIEGVAALDRGASELAAVDGSD
jgi:tetratricopeptide (TPR) repeat protein